MGIASALGAVSAVSNIVGGFGGKGDQEDAAEASAAGNNAAIANINAATERNAPRFDEARENFDPFLEGGTDGFNLLKSILLGETSADDALVKSPGFDFRRQQGEDAIERGQKTRGNFLSGEGLEELVNFNQGQATSEFDQFIRRLFALSGTGQNAAGSIAGLTSNQAGQELGAAGQVAGFLGNTGEAKANAAVNGGAAVRTGINGAIGNIAGAINPLKSLGSEFLNFNNNLAVV